MHLLELYASEYAKIANESYGVKRNLSFSISHFLTQNDKLEIYLTYLCAWHSYIRLAYRYQFFVT